MTRYLVVDVKRGKAQEGREVRAAGLQALSSVEGWPSMYWQTERDDAGRVWFVGRRGTTNRVHVKVCEQ